MPGARGIGGVFLDSADPAALAAWYDEHLAVGFVEHPDGGSFYRVFHTRDIETSEVRENPVLAINPAAGPLAPGDQRGHILGLRVDDLDAVLDHLATVGITTDGDLLEWEGGRHARIRDPEGNRVELYEELPLAPDSPYRTHDQYS